MAPSQKKTQVKKGSKRSKPTSDTQEDDALSQKSQKKGKKAAKRQKRQTQSPESESDSSEVVVEENEGALSDVNPEMVVSSDNDKNDTDKNNVDASDIEDRHRARLPKMKAVKAELTRDLLTIFSERLKVKFGNKGEKLETLKGRWCLVCKLNNNLKKREAFFLGDNSTCRGHIRQHYELYKERCLEQNIELNHYCIPRDVWKKMQEEKKAKTDLTLDNMFTKKVQKPNPFSREGVLHAVAQLVACGDNSLALVDKTVFRNCLVAMRPHATCKDLPSAHNVSTHIHNEYVRWMEGLKRDITVAPGKVSCTADCWTADYTKISYLGVTAHWIEVKDKVWTLRANVVGFRSVSGEHSGWNLGRYFMGTCDRAGICTKSESKLYAVTLDNTSNNNTTCETLESIHEVRQYERWSMDEKQLPCLAHVVNLANVDIMKHITKIAAVETATAIWEYDPTLEDNRVLGGSLDVIAAIRTIAIKIQSSGQRIEYFYRLQVECKATEPKKIPLHSNVRWGTAHAMLDRAVELRQSIKMFIKSADELYGPITTIRQKGQIVKKIKWMAFALSERDWKRVEDARDILKDSNRIQHHFSSERVPTLWTALPALERLQTQWEKKRDSPRFSIYCNAINDGLQKIRKYYNRLDRKPSYILALVLHPYYKLAYIEKMWGGAKEQAEEIEAGNINALNWQDEARQVVEHAMEYYWNNRPHAQLSSAAARSANNLPCSQVVGNEDSDDDLDLEYEQFRRSMASDGVEEGWAAELRRYLSDMPKNATKDMDLIRYWQDTHPMYPTLGRIALDVLPAQASSVPCERLFSSGKQIADDRRARLGAEKFEQLQIMKFAWRNNIKDLATWNSEMVEEIEMHEFQELLAADDWADEFSKDADEFILDD